MAFKQYCRVSQQGLLKNIDSKLQEDRIFQQDIASVMHEPTFKSGCTILASTKETGSKDVPTLTLLNFLGVSCQEIIR